MNHLNLRIHLANSLKMVSSYPVVLYYLAIVALCSTSAFFVKDSPLYWPLNLLSVVLSLTATPVFYGIFYQLITDSYTSIGQIARKYVLNYLWLLIRMYLPVIACASLPVLLTAGGGSRGYIELTLIFFSLVYLYVIPFYYHSGRQNGAISAGVRFLLKNLAVSTPLILTVLLLEAGMLLFQYAKMHSAATVGITLIGLDFAAYMAASIVDLILFIVIIFILEANDPGDDR
jgi:hypothetical protein